MPARVARRVPTARRRRAFLAVLLKLDEAPGINLKTMTALELLEVMKAQASCARGPSGQPLTGTPVENEARLVKTKQPNEVDIRADERYHRCLLMLKDGCWQLWRQAGIRRAIAQAGRGRWHECPDRSGHRLVPHHPGAGQLHARRQRAAANKHAVAVPSSFCLAVHPEGPRLFYIPDYISGDLHSTRSRVAGI